MKLTAPCLVGFALLSAACSSSTSDKSASPVVGNKSDAAPADAASALGAYPAGPYGNAVGDVLTDLKLQGYVDDAADAIANTKPFVDSYSLEDVRASGAKYALVHVSEFL